MTVVEDGPRAEAVSKYTPAAAIVGTSISEDLVRFFRKLGVKHLRICLDQDAQLKALQLKRKHELVFDSIHVVFVNKDPKDMTSAELCGIFGGEGHGT